MSERLNTVHRVEPEHHHPDDPEEEDVVAGDENTVRIELLELRRLIRPAERGERPQRRREPGVEDVGVLRPPVAGGRFLARTDADDLAARSVPHRNAVPPPLPADTSVVHRVDPAEEAWLHARRVNGDPSVANSIAGGWPAAQP